MKRFTASLALLLMPWTLGCIPEEERASVTIQMNPPDIASFNDPGWSPSTGEDDPVVARVGEAAIHLSELQHHVAAHGGAVAPSELLDQLIEMEAMAQVAWNRNLQSEEDVLRDTQRQAVSTMLHDLFVVNHDESAIKQEDLEFWYARAIRKFDHYAGFFMMDAQFVCCTDEAEDCEQSADAQSCLDDMEPVAKYARELLVERGPHADDLAYEGAVNLLGGDLQSPIPPAAMRISINNQMHDPYEAQKNFTTYHADLVRAVVDMLPDNWTDSPSDDFGVHILSPGVMGPAVRSHHAWHIPLLYRFIPERHDTLENPEVRKEISAGIYPLIQKRDHARLIQDLEKRVGVEVTSEYLQLLDAAEKGQASEESSSAP